MGYAASYLTALKEKPLAGLFVQEYMVEDKVLNAMKFSNKAVNSNANSLGYTVVRNEDVDGLAATREFGSDYATVNSNPVAETYYLKVFGGKYSIDATMEEIIKKINAENEARQKMAAAVKEFARQLVKGTGANGEFLGMDKFCTDNSLVTDITLELDGAITEAKAIELYSQFTQIAGSLNVDANAIICSKLMESKLVAAEAVANKNTQKLAIGTLNYNTYMGLPILPIDNAVGLRKTDGVSGDVTEDIYLVRIDENNGVFCASPADASAFVKVTKPVANGTPIETGYVDFATCFIPKNRKAIVKASVLVQAGA
jgi:hypothetical protein